MSPKEMANQKMKISELADQVRNIPLHEVLERYGFEAKPEGTTLRAKSEHHNIVLTGSLWFDNRAGVAGAGAIDLVIHIAIAAVESPIDALGYYCLRAGRPGHLASRGKLRRRNCVA
jgi:hypothetical protein